MPRPDAFRDHDHRLDQGDILADVPFVRWDDGVAGPGEPGRGIITSHGCACEDFDRAVQQGRSRAIAKLMLHVAPLVRAEQFPEQIRDMIEQGGYFDRFYIYGDGPSLGDHVLDFTREQSIPAYVLADCTRIASVAEWQWARLLVHQSVSRFRQDPATMFRADVLAPATGGTDEA